MVISVGTVMTSYKLKNKELSYCFRLLVKKAMCNGNVAPGSGRTFLYFHHSIVLIEIRLFQQG